MQKFRIVSAVSNHNQKAIYCDICLENKRILVNCRGKPRNAVIVIAPIDGNGNDIEINNISRFFQCKMHFDALRHVGAIASIAEQMGLKTS